MQCNINAKGKAVRLIGGVLLLLGAGVIGLLSFTEVWQSPAAAWCAGVLALAGATGVFEGAAGWCVVRAMGFRTPW